MAYILLTAPESSDTNAASGGAAAGARYHRGTVEVEVGDHLPETYGIRNRKTFWRGPEVSIGVVQVIAEMVAICEGVRIVGGFHGYWLDVMTQLRRSKPSLLYSCGANITRHIVKNNSFKLPLKIGRAHV